MSIPIVVKTSDITVKSNGIGGFELTYYGNSKWFARTLKGVDQLSLTDALNDFVIYLNSLPIKK